MNLAVGDFNEDGAPDFAMATSATSESSPADTTPLVVLSHI